MLDLASMERAVGDGARPKRERLAERKSVVG